MTVIGDIFQIDLIGTIGGKLAVNTFHYRANTGDFDSADVALEFNASVHPAIEDVEGVRKLYDEISVKNLFDPLDDVSVSPTITGGSVLGEDGGGHSAIPMKMFTESRDVRDGAKRYGPLSETYNADGIITGGGLLTALDTLAVAMESNLDLGAGHSVTPVIVKRILYQTGEDQHDAYRLPENLGESEYSLISGVAPVLRATTQNSRKSWVGA